MEILVLIFPNWDSVQQDLPRLGFVEVLQEGDAAAFSAAVQAHQRCHFPGAKLKGDVLGHNEMQMHAK